MSQSPQQIPNTPPFCKDCSHFIPEVKYAIENPLEAYQASYPPQPPRCRKFPMLDVVMGERFFVACHAIRGQDAPCGIEGKLFEPNDDLDATPATAPIEPENQDLN